MSSDRSLMRAPALGLVLLFLLLGTARVPTASGDGAPREYRPPSNPPQAEPAAAMDIILADEQFISGPLRGERDVTHRQIY